MYCEVAPPAVWANVVECLWTRTPDLYERDAEPDPQGASAERQTHKVLPDGGMDVIASLHTDGSLDQAFVVGAMTRPIESSLGNQPLVGIRFLPGAGGTALAANAAHFTDRQFPLIELLPARSRVMDALRTLVANARDARAFAEFAVQLGLQGRSVPSFVREATRQLAIAPRSVRVDSVAQALGVSRQHLTRTFSAHSGLTPKQFATICRVRALLAEVRVTAARSKQSAQPRIGHAASRNAPCRTDELISHPTRDSSVGSLRHESTARQVRVSWSDVAARYGYADQSHLIADVHAITGLTPGKWERAAGSIIPIVPVPVGAL